MVLLDVLSPLWVDQYAVWSQQKLNIMRADGETLHGQGSGTITLVIDSTNSVKADNLIMDSLLIGFNMLI